MDDIMILMHRLLVDVQGFNESHFGIFNENERRELLSLWETYAGKNPNKFIALLSPDQKLKIVSWTIERTEYNIVDVIKALESFVKMLKRVKYTRSYPLVPAVATKGKKTALKSMFRS